MTTIIDDIASIARRAPDAEALIWHRCAWSYDELRHAIACVHGKLREVGLAPGDRVALLLRNSPHYVAAYFGSLAAGCVIVPLNVHERAQVLTRQIAHVGCRALIFDVGHPESEALARLVSESDLASIPIAVHDEPDAHVGFCQAMGPVVEAHHVSEDDELAMVLYTSGTTARPKAVMLSHRNLASNAAAISDYLEIVPTDRVLCVLPFHFSYGMSVVNSNLRAGACLLIEDNFAFPHVVLQRMEAEGATGFPGVPATFALILGRCRLEHYDLTSLRYITQAGGPMPRAYVERLRSHLPHVAIFLMYGQSEATARLTWLPPDKLDEKPGSVGRPIAGTEIEIRNNDEVVPRGEIGEICARGPGIMLGYWGDPERSASVLRGGWLHTGDLGYMDEEGYVYISARMADIIKVGAFRVSPQEVEEVLAAHPDVEEVAVTGMADELTGQAVKAVIVPRAGAEPNPRSIKAHCREHLAAYKVPKVVEFVVALPRTSSGKVQRYKLS